MKLSKWLSFFLLPLGLVLMGCSEDKGATSDEKLPQIVMGTSADMPPFEFYKASKIVGYDIDIARAIAEELELDLQVRDMDFSALIPSLQSKRVEFAMASMTPTPERE
ncbi:MAG: transporter substrate-binding domain-containing protein, partial [Simkaniaceae bacterium]|nr:transporter substrate-binding domain-containing protein [Simkaniaceae bacterium]